MQARSAANPKGIDVSHWQGKIDWDKVKESGISFAIIKATEGVSMIDEYLQANIEGATAVGIAVGAYHFCRASNVTEAVQEAQTFCRVLDSVGGVQSLDIAPILDIETVHAKTKENITDVCHAWVDEVKKQCNVDPMIYASRSFIDDYLDESLSKYKLWLAAYGTDQPTDRNGWSEWEFLQFTEKGTVPGIYGYVDMNEYRGSVEELMYKLNKEDAQKIIDRWLSHEYDYASEADKVERHRLADELRKASGIPIE